MFAPLSFCLNLPNVSLSDTILLLTFNMPLF